MPQSQHPADATARPASTGDVLAAAAQAADALAALHGRGRLHGGLCPAALRWDGAAGCLQLLPPADVQQPAAFMSPEQTGRLNLPLQPHSDLYSLGLVLYDWLTGSPPFTSDDALAQVHWHLAGRAEPPDRRNPRVPAMLSAIVMRLIEKAPDARYPSARALARDLVHCRTEWRRHGRIGPFELAAESPPAPPLHNDLLVGRAAEAAALQQAWQRCREGNRMCVLVEGYAGSGKTWLVQQVLRPRAEAEGAFVAGKFDQVVRGLPFGALLRAFDAWVQDLLGASDARVQRWHRLLLAALGPNVSVLVQWLPALRHVVGPQPAPPELGPTEAHNRLRRVLQQFVGALARPDHPLLLFLDDLQWADAATLSLLEALAGSDDIGHLLLLGAMRDRERDAAPQLLRTLDAIGPERVAVAPLDVQALGELLAGTLRAAPGPLAALLHDKTAGNPFFAMQFLQGLRRDGRLHWDAAAGCWRWDLAAVHAAPLAADVVDLIARRIDHLEPAVRQVLQRAACIGNRFDAGTLATVAGLPRAAVDAAVASAHAEGLLLADGAAWRFLHDRVQQAAYARIAPDQREAVHLQVGRLLLAGTPPEAREAALFDITHHLNAGRRLITEAAEREAVAALDLAAGRAAKRATAFEAALALFETGLELAPGFELQLEVLECRMLCGRPADPAAHAALAASAPTRIDRARALRLHCVQLERQERHAESLATGREALALFGVELPEDADAKSRALEHEIEFVERLRAGRAIADLIALPAMQDPDMRIVMATLTDLWSAAYLLGDSTLARLISALLVRLSLQQGHAEESAYGYVTHAITVGALRGDLRAADAWGRLALAVNQRLDDRRLRAKIYQQFHAHVNFWCQPLRSCVEYARLAHRAGLDGGDFLYAAFAAGTEPWAALASCDDLAAFVHDYAPAVGAIEQLGSPAFADSVRQMRGWAHALQGRTRAPLSMGGDGFDEDEWLARYGAHRFFAAIHAVCHLMLAVLMGTAAEAEAAARRSASLIDALPGTLWPLLHEFWHALALARAATADAQAVVRRARAAFAAREPFNVANHRPQALLLQAVLAQLEGRDGDAVAAGQQAVEFSAVHASRLLQALSHEQLAQAHGRCGQPALQALHRARAHALYTQWGALAKAAQFVADESPAAVSRPAAPAGDALDLASVLKATQAVSGETELGALRARLLHIAIENAGAGSGALVLDEGGEWQVHAWQPGGPLLPPQPLAAQRDVPAQAVQRVRRTGLPWTHDDPAQACVPLVRQGHTIGVLYVAHRHAMRVFTPERVAVLQALATQAAISLENARLVTGLRDALAEVQRLRDELAVENSVLRRDLVANVSHDLRTPLVSLRGYLELVAARDERLSPADRAQYLGIAIRQGERLGALIDELFELAKLDYRGTTLQRERFPFADLAADVAQKFALEADRRGVVLVLDVPARLPPMVGDIGLLERVLDNLIGNALKHTPAGGQVVVRAHADADADGGLLVVEVCDSGRGIDAKDLAHVFDRGWRSSRGGDGAGLGLAIARRIVELHGGRIGAASTPGVGSRFWFGVPRHAPEVSQR